MSSIWIERRTGGVGRSPWPVTVATALITLEVVIPAWAASGTAEAGPCGAVGDGSKGFSAGPGRRVAWTPCREGGGVVTQFETMSFVGRARSG